MTRMWLKCIKGTKTLRNGERYLVELRGSQAKVLRDSENPHRRYGTIVNRNRFGIINMKRVLKPGDKVRLINSGRNWAPEMTEIVRRNPIVTVTRVKDNEKIEFYGGKAYSWLYSDGHFEPLKKRITYKE